VPTLPVLLMQRANRQEDADLLAALAGDLSGDAALADVIRKLRAHPVMDEAREVTAKWASDAMESLNPLPNSPAKSALQALCTFVVTRSV
ncbi:MAG: polyprenyl synthetase family protein, partial [Frankiaceae bacterium]|nr:polyprenyl synthetase family protein [Frankiaceae bacterium]